MKKEENNINIELEKMKNEYRIIKSIVFGIICMVGVIGAFWGREGYLWVGMIISIMALIYFMGDW